MSNKTDYEKCQQFCAKHGFILKGSIMNKQAIGDMSGRMSAWKGTELVARFNCYRELVTQYIDWEWREKNKNFLIL